MNDWELLELAAKAVNGGCWHPITHDTPMGRPWNPLTDDGDALRLAVNLRLFILHNDQGEEVLWVCAVDNKQMIYEEEEFADESERAAATRRAVLRCAAEIGRAMP